MKPKWCKKKSHSFQIEIHKIRPQGTKNDDGFVKCLPKTSGKRSPNTCLNDLGGIISDMTDTESLSPSHPHILSSLKDLGIFTWKQKHILNLFCKCNDVVAVVEASEGSKGLW